MKATSPRKLEWAAQWAYSSKLKQAAQVLLETPRASISEVDEKPKDQSEFEFQIAEAYWNLHWIKHVKLFDLAPYKGQSMGVL